MSICGGIAGARGRAPIGFFIHNDAGGASLDADWWANAYASGRHDLNKGFVHYHVDKNHVVQCEDDSNCAWHCGQSDGNVNYLSLEVDQSMGASDSDFLIAEDRALQLVADKFNEYGIEPNANTVRLHQEVFATACPHRSVELHGGAQNCKQYFIDKISEKMGKGPGRRHDMTCIYNKGDGALYYYDGRGIKRLDHPDEAGVLDKIHQAEYGTDVPRFDWTDRSAPWDGRLEDVARKSYIN